MRGTKYLTKEFWKQLGKTCIENNNNNRQKKLMRCAPNEIEQNTCRASWNTVLTMDQNWTMKQSIRNKFYDRWCKFLQLCCTWWCVIHIDSFVRETPFWFFKKIRYTCLNVRFFSRCDISFFIYVLYRYSYQNNKMKENQKEWEKFEYHRIVKIFFKKKKFLLTECGRFQIAPTFQVTWHLIFRRYK